MKQVFLFVNSGAVKHIEVPKPTVKDNTVIVETEYSIVSAGTERMLTSFGGKNLLQKALERPDQVKKVTEKMSTDGILTTMNAAFQKLEEPMPVGYSGVGKVLEVGRGVTDIKVGDYVAMAGTAYHAEINRVGKNLVVKLPETFKDRRQAAFCALGGIALEGIHQAQVVPGETVAVVGMGLVGHILIRILDAYGCDVIGYDIADKSLPKTKIKAFINSGDENAEDITKNLTNGRGVDKVIITASTHSNAPMDLAAAIVRDRGVICMIGVTRMDIDRRPFYKKELSFTIARSYGPGRYEADYEEKGVDIPIGHVRFTEGRNIEEFIRLIDTGRMDVSDLITHVIPFDKAESAYEMITTNSNKEKYIGILLSYPENEQKISNIVKYKTVEKKEGMIGVGMIGGGGFARSTILPLMKENAHFSFIGMATTGGISTAQTISTTDFSYTTNNYTDLLSDDSIDLIVVSTNHNSHAKFIIEAVNAGKSVYCEKPLCIASEDLERIMEAYKANKGQLFCGLNRRHAPLIHEVKKRLQTERIPAVYDYIMNAGFIPSDHWTQDEKTGGGRIIGEACHIVDLIQAMDGSELKKLNIVFAGNEAYPNKDNAFITLQFASGAVGNILYTSMGSKKYPKETLRVFSNGMVAEVNNFLSMEIFGSQHRKTTKLRQDKGISNEYAYIVDVLRNGKENKAIEDAFVSHRMLLEELGK